MVPYFSFLLIVFNTEMFSQVNKPQHIKLNLQEPSCDVLFQYLLPLLKTKCIMYNGLSSIFEVGVDVQKVAGDSSCCGIINILFFQ